MNSQKHALYGRRFDTSMLWYDVSNYDCCGKIFINHDDTLLERENIIRRSHLPRKKHKAWKCCCIKTCNGEQFHCPKKTTQIHYFSLHHDGKDPWEFLNLTENNPNASICDFCYKDEPDGNSKYVSMFNRCFEYLYMCFTFFFPKIWNN